MTPSPVRILPRPVLRKLIFPLLIAATPLLRGEEITTSDGQVIKSTSFRRSGNVIMIKTTTAEGGVIEVGFPVARITRVSFPEPPELSKASAAASAGKAAEVLSLTGEYVSKQGEFKDVPGSWWPRMAELRLLALASVGKNEEASSLAREIGAIKSPLTESLARGGTLFGPLATGETEAVTVGAKSLPRIGGDEGSALAQLALGRTFLQKKDGQGAIRAFLTVKIFYPTATLLQPAALLGAANACLLLKDEERATQTLRDLMALYPESPQASEAKKIVEGLSKS